jgi:FixJ family two-component response regulator
MDAAPDAQNSPTQRASSIPTQLLERKAHRGQAIRKMQVNSLAELVRIAGKLELRRL